MDRTEAQNDEAKIELQKAVMRRKDENQEENLETIQRSIEEAAGKVAYSAKNDRDKALKQTPENVTKKKKGKNNVRILEEAAARCTKVIKRRVLKKKKKR